MFYNELDVFMLGSYAEFEFNKEYELPQCYEINELLQIVKEINNNCQDIAIRCNENLLKDWAIYFSNWFCKVEGNTVILKDNCVSYFENYNNSISRRKNPNIVEWFKASKFNVEEREAKKCLKKE